jgi:protein MBA1
MGPMAFGVSRTYLSLAATASSRFSTPVIYLRSYASAAAVATIKNRLPAATRSAATKAAKSAASGQQVLTQAEQMEQLDRILSASQNMPTTDVWGQKVETLGMCISPYFDRHSPFVHQEKML